LLAADLATLLSGIPALHVDRNAYHSSQLLVRFDESVASARDYLQAAADVSLRGALAATSIPVVSGLHKVALGSGVAVESALAALRNDPHVLFAEPDYIVRATGIPTDPLFVNQWDFHNTGQSGGTFDADIDAPEAWDVTTGSGSTIVAVLDTGVDYLHPDLAANIWVNQDELAGNGIDDDLNGYVDDIRGYDFYNNDNNPLDDHGHGTHVAGTIGAVGNNGIGIAGVNWNVQIMPLKFLGADGSGTTSDAIEALRYAIDNGAHISNNSWGGDPFSQSLYNAIRDARDVGHIFVAAAGNGNFIGFGIDNDATPFYPSSYDLDNIVAVAATDSTDNIAVFSNYGATSVDLGAPGVSILSTLPNGNYGLNSGTSMAAPHVAGALSLVRDHVPGLTYRQIIDRVLASTDPLTALDGKTATGGRLNVAAALVPDTVGPRIAATQPDGLMLDPVSSIRITFDESIDPATFTLADIARFEGPNGNIGPLTLNAVAGTNNRQFTLAFPAQSTPGEYELEISPTIADRLGNLLDQDDDGTGGELMDDLFSGGFQIASAVARFDFGTSSSPVAAGYTGHPANHRYSAADGYGWLTGSVFGLSRTVGDSLTRDVNYTKDATFALDVANGEYDVIVTLGDTGQPHDLMGVFLEGAQVDTVTTTTGQTVARTYRVTVGDGQLSLRLFDQGGSDPWVMINGLDLVSAGADVTGPHVTFADPGGTVTGPADRIRLGFSEDIDSSSFTIADVALLEGPMGTIAPLAVNALGETEFEVVFAPQNGPGQYRLVVGPNITDAAGNLMDQDQDGANGEEPDDRFETTFTLEAGPQYVARFDFGTLTSPVAEGYTGHPASHRYSASDGYGWQTGSVFGLSRNSGTDLTRDVNYTKDATFAVDLANGEYDVVVTLGDMSQPHDQMGVFLEGTQVDTVSTAAGQPVARTYRVAVGDGQLNLRLFDLGGSGPWVMISGLDVLATPDELGPRVASVDLVGTVAGPVDRIRLQFSEEIDASSFTLADVVLVEGPLGAIAPVAVQSVSSTEFEVVFAPQSAPGLYRVVVGPHIADATGNAMDQDEDGVGGENPGDRFEATFTISAGPEVVARFDFGTTSSPVAEGYTRHPANHRYSVEDGYGWLVGSVFGISRVGSDALLRDFNYSEDATFALDLANGQYDVTVTLGDLAEAHDMMGVFLEGEQVDTVTTAAGQNAVGTYRITVRDGQLNLRLFDLGGSDEWVMINGLVVATPGVGIEAMAFSAGSISGSAVQSHAQQAAEFKLAAPRVLSSIRTPLIEKALDLLFTDQSSRRGKSPKTVSHEVRDHVMASLVDSSSVRDIERDQHQTLSDAWDALSWRLRPSA
jgi:subtilisin family serine protease/fibronectin type 3 domain-containing protein